MNSTVKKSLGLWMLTSLVAGNMIGSGIFLLPASLASYGSVSILSWVFTSIGAILLALVFARLGHMMPRTGGAYAYCREAYGEFVGFQVAYNYWIAVCIGNAAIVVALVGYLSEFWPALDKNPMDAFWVSLSLVWFVTGINVIGVREAGRVQVLTTILKLIPLVIIATIGLFFIKSDNLSAFNVSHLSNLSAFTAAATLTFWSFVGFESATVPAEHVINPERNIPRATILGTSIAAAVYIFSTIAVMGIMPMSALVHSSSPYADAAQHIFGFWGAKIVGLAAVVACFGTLNGWILMQAQVPLAAARDNLFPKAFARVGANQTPIFGLVVSSMVITALLVMRYGASLVNQFTFMILLATLASLIPYVYTAFAEIIILLRDPAKVERKRLIKSLVLATLAFAFGFWGIIGAGAETVYYGALLLISSVPLYGWLRWRMIKAERKKTASN